MRAAAIIGGLVAIAVLVLVGMAAAHAYEAITGRSLARVFAVAAVLVLLIMAASWRFASALTAAVAP